MVSQMYTPGITWLTGIVYHSAAGGASLKGKVISRLSGAVACLELPSSHRKTEAAGQ